MAKLSWLAAALLCGSWATATAQNAISARAGLVQVADGDVFVNDTAIHSKVAEFTDLKNTDVLRTAEGRAEVLLTPGAFVRVGDNSSFRMVSSRLSDVRLEVLQGEALVEITEMLSDNAINVTLGNANFQLAKGGLFDFASDPARLRVYKGEAVAVLGEKYMRVREGHQLAFNGSDWTQSSFDTKDTDALYRWSQRRAENVAVANVSAARQSANSFDTYASNGYPSMGYGAYGMGGYGGYGMGGLDVQPVLRDVHLPAVLRHGLVAIRLRLLHADHGSAGVCQYTSDSGQTGAGQAGNDARLDPE
jgi:predicted house-cleaning NTP pyrophosphatase (Maf/HAM1 superfamily)